MSFANIFRQHAGARGQLAAAKELEPVLGGILERAEAAWPGVAVPPGEFLRHLALNLPSGVDFIAALNEMHTSDLYLACACLRGDGVALRAFDKQILQKVAGYFANRHDDPAFADELRQRLRTHLFTSDDGGQPKISTYAGQGPLTRWLRTTASRMAVDMHRENKRHNPDSEQGLDIRSSSLDPELDYLKTRYRGELEKALATTLATLSLNESNMLRMHFLEGMTIEAMCGVYGTSMRTMHRRIAEVRQRMLDETRRLLAERLDLSASQITSVMRLAQSQLQISLAGFLRDPTDAK